MSKDGMIIILGVWLLSRQYALISSRSLRTKSLSGYVIDLSAEFCSSRANVRGVNSRDRRLVACELSTLSIRHDALADRNLKVIISFVAGSVAPEES